MSAVPMKKLATSGNGLDFTINHTYEFATVLHIQYISLLKSQVVILICSRETTLDK